MIAPLNNMIRITRQIIPNPSPHNPLPGTNLSIYPLNPLSHLLLSPQKIPPAPLTHRHATPARQTRTNLNPATTNQSNRSNAQSTTKIYQQYAWCTHPATTQRIGLDQKFGYSSVTYLFRKPWSVDTRLLAQNYYSVSLIPL